MYPLLERNAKFVELFFSFVSDRSYAFESLPFRCVINISLETLGERQPMITARLSVFVADVFITNVPRGTSFLLEDCMLKLVEFYLYTYANTAI